MSNTEIEQAIENWVSGQTKVKITLRLSGAELQPAIFLMRDKSFLIFNDAGSRMKLNFSAIAKMEVVE